jgi:outer membrane protein assembly factor BamD (BamD/ComL family)
MENKKKRLTGLPPKQGLYDPAFEHDACGVGFIVDIHGRKSHAIVKDALTILLNLDHRGAVGSEHNTGDGAGILTQMPDKFLRRVCAEQGIHLPELGKYGAGVVFSSPEEAEAKAAQENFEKIAADYPNPAGQEPAAAPPAIQEAQAISIFGLGRVAQEQKDVTGAGALFEKLKTLYPWSPKVLEANYGIAASLKEQGKGDEAVALLTQIIRAPNAPTDLRANAMLLGGFIQKDKGERDAAIDYFIKISAFYEGVPTAAAAGLWEGGQLLELQVTELQTSDPEKANKQKAQVLRAYKELTEKFPDSEFAPKAQERLNALGPP